MSASIMQTVRECYLCRAKYNVITMVGLEEHHVIGGPLRSKAEHYGLKVWLCHRHHNEPGESAHFDSRTRLFLKRRAQAAFEARYGHERWMTEFGKDYLSCST
nr:MAG TPA: hypothetical protein [Caudoviricetes sp.]